MFPKKSLGQNFLKNESVARDLVDSLEIKNTDTVLEVGPGRGAITRILLQKTKRVVAVEKDADLVALLKNKFAEEIRKGAFQLICGDILEFSPHDWELETGNWKLIGAIPYYITGQLIRKFLGVGAPPKTIALIIQKEVAERIVAKNGKESILSISVKVYGEPHYIKTVKAGSFYPAPKVDSAILVIKNISKDFFKTIEEEEFFKLLKAGFASRRKKLTTNLKKHFPKTDLPRVLKNIEISPNVRAEDLTRGAWRKLYVALQELSE